MRSGLISRGSAQAASANAAIAAALAAALLAALLIVPAGAAAGKTERADRALDRALERLVSRPDGPPGAIAVVQRNDSRRVHSAGAAELGKAGKPRAALQMRIASTAKAMSGATALSLVSRGKLSLRATIGDLVPSLPAAWHAVTVRQLLQHTSGVPDFTGSPGFAAAVSADPLDPPPPPQLLSYVENEPLAFPPGSDYAYSNSDNVIIGLIVEAVTGRSYPGELQRLVTDRLGMPRTYLDSRPAVAEPTLHGYAPDPPGGFEDVTNLVDFGGWAWASGGVVSTPGNMNTFIRGYVGGDLYRGLARRDQFYGFIAGAHSEPRGPGRNAAGPALFRYRTSCGTVFGHTGSILGYTQFIAATRDGSRSATFTITSQYDDGLLPALRRAEEKAVCAALA